MSKKAWKRICVNLTIEQESDLKRLASYKSQRTAHLVQKLIESYINENKAILEALNSIPKDL
jgi:predicted DNA-binding protein